MNNNHSNDSKGRSRIIPLVVFFTGLMLLAFDCDYKPDAVGMAREVYIFTARKKWVESEISMALENQIFTPQPGVEFLLRYKKMGDLENSLIRHGLLFVGLEQDSIIRFAKSIYPALTSHDSFNLYTIKDLWAAKQTVVVFVAADSQHLVDGLDAVRSLLRKEFKIKLLERLEGVTYGGGDDKKLSAGIEKYGFRLRVPERWYLEEGFAADHFVWVHAFEPDRLIFIYWEDVERADVSRQAMLLLRDSLTARFYEGDYLYLPLTAAGPYYFRGNEAVRIDGVWQNDSMSVGGPMIGFAFNADGRFWMIDAMLFYPETPRKKIFWLNQLEVILATFRPIQEAI